MTARKTARPHAYVRQKPYITRALWLSFAGFLAAGIAGFAIGWAFMSITFGGT